MFSAVTCTSRECEWNKGSLARDPEEANKRQYDSFKINVPRRATFDVRPTEYQLGYPDTKAINNFLCAISYKESHWSLLMKIEYEDGEYGLDDLLVYFSDLRDQLMTTLECIINELKPHKDYIGPLEVTETRGQSNNTKWTALRSLHVTASTARKVAHFEKDSAKMNHLQKHLWNLNNIRTRAMKYGIKNEKAARLAYWNLRLNDDPTVSVRDTGLFLNTENPGLSCSPDGYVTSDTDPPRILEIKCPFSLRSCHPSEFEKVIKEKRLSSFYLIRSADNEITLNQNHEYYDQIQMNLAMTGVLQCDLVVWSKEGTLVIPVFYEERMWLQLKYKLLEFHWNYQAPEYFLMRTVRNLPPLFVP